MLKKLLGIVLILIGIFGLALSLVGIIVGRDLIDSLSKSLDQSLDLTVESLDTVSETLVLTKKTVASVSAGLDTVSETADGVATSLFDSQTLLDQVTEVVVGDVPDSVAAVEDAIPDVVVAAGAIDETLMLLDRFQIDRRILGVPIRFDLGINYDPSLPLDDTVGELGKSLDGLPERLRELESSLDEANENLVAIGEDVDLISGDLDQVNKDLEEVDPLLEDYIRLTTEATDMIRQSRSNLSKQLVTTKLVITVLFVWIGLNQIVPLYLAGTLLRRRDVDEQVDGEPESE